MSTTDDGSSEQPKYRILDTPPPADAPGPRLDDLPPGEEVDGYVIEDLDAADSPTGGVGRGCYCQYHCKT